MTCRSDAYPHCYRVTAGKLESLITDKQIYTRKKEVLIPSNNILFLLIYFYYVYYYMYVHIIFLSLYLAFNLDRTRVEAL